MSMFTGLTSQISGMINKAKGEGGEDNQEVAEGIENGAAAGGELDGAEGAEQATGAGKMGGLAQGLMMKAMSAKDGIKEKASNFQPPNLQGLGGSLMQGVTNLIPGKKEEDVPTPPDPNPPTADMGGEVLESEEQMAE